MTPTPVVTATPVAHAVVGGTGGQGVYARQLPGLTAIVAGLPDGSIVQLTGQHVIRDGYTWVQAVLPDDRVVWIAQPYLVPYRQYLPPHQ